VFIIPISLFMMARFRRSRWAVARSFVVMLIGAALAAMPVLHRTTERAAVPPAERAGFGTLIVGLLLGYFAWFGAFGR